MVNEASVVQVPGQWSVNLFGAMAFALVVFSAFSSIEASERVIQGQVYGIDRSEGVWVGIVSDERTRNDSWEVPHNRFEEDEIREEKLNWAFSSNGEFELTTEVEEKAILLIVAKNRLPVEVALHPNEEWKPIEVSLSPGVGVKGVVQAKDGKPIAGATISFLRNGRDYRVPLFARPLFTSAADGSFHLTGLESSSRYIVGVTATGYAPLVLQSIEVREGGIGRLELELDEGYFVSGRVVGDDMKPLPDINVIARWHRVSVRVLESDSIVKATPFQWLHYRSNKH